MFECSHKLNLPEVCVFTWFSEKKYCKFVKLYWTNSNCASGIQKQLNTKIRSFIGEEKKQTHKQTQMKKPQSKQQNQSTKQTSKKTYKPTTALVRVRSTES